MPTRLSLSTEKRLIAIPREINHSLECARAVCVINIAESEHNCAELRYLRHIFLNKRPCAARLSVSLFLSRVATTN